MLCLKQPFVFHYILFLLPVLNSITCCAQEIMMQQQLENLVDANEEETEDDGFLQQMERYRRNPLNINEANEDELGMLSIVNASQVSNFIRYRQMLGKLISVYELQAVPGWDPALIRKLLPFITVLNTPLLTTALTGRLHEGSHTLMLRVSRVMEKQKGFSAGGGGTKYNGSVLRIFARYKYSYKNLLQFGWTGDKDAGEQFFRGRQRMGFDFNSVHLFARKLGAVEALALGDFSVNLGQGLIQWQSLAFKKSGETMGVKRQSPVLRPYNSAGEYNFYRGVGVTIRKRFVEWTVFASIRQLSANRNEDSSGAFVSSIITSGYHRTNAEEADRHVLKQFVSGAAVRYRRSRMQIGLNAIHYSFSLPLKKRDEPYNLFAIRGRQWMNASVDHSYTWRNIHLFGEVAIDRNMSTAILQGCMISAAANIDISVVYRNIAKEYQALNASAFTENASPSNERGCYVGFSIRPVYGWKLDMYADFYQFPWLKYLIDAPSYGKDFLIQLTYTPSKQVELQGRIGHSLRMQEAPRAEATDYLTPVYKTSSQLQLNYALSKDFTFRSRMQILWLLREQRETGFSLSLDALYKPGAKPFSISSRLQFFETDGYNTRLYGFENDLPYSYSIPAIFGKGIRYYLVVQMKMLRKMSLGWRWAQTIYRQQTEIGTGLDLINGNKRSEIRMQCMYAF